MSYGENAWKWLVGLFDENISYGTDYDLWLRISRHFDFECIERPLVHYHVHENSLTNDLTKVVNGYNALLHKYPGLLDRHKYGNKYFSCGVNMCLAGDMKNGIRTLMQSWKLNPFEIRIFPYIFFGLFGVASFKKYITLNKLIKKKRSDRANRKLNVSHS